MSALRVYGLKNCDSCREARRWLEARGAAFEFVDYRETPVDAATLQAWAAALGGLDKLANRRSTTWRKLLAADQATTGDAAWLALLLAHPTLVKRPLLSAGNVVRVGFADADWSAVLATDGCS